MSVAFALTVGPIVVAWLAPAVLRMAIRRVNDPFAVLLAWLSTTAAVLVTFASGVIMLLIPGAGPQASIGHLAHHCWLAVRHGRPPATDEVFGAVGAIAVVTLVTRFAVVAVRHRRVQHESRRAHHDLLTLLGATPGPGREPVLRMPHQTPLAYSIGGRRGLVVVSAGVQQLPPAQLAAVLCHEAAHLRGRHHLIVSVADALAAAVPWVPLTQQAPDAVRLLVELAADATAVRACGSSAVRAALVALTGAPRPVHALPMAGADVAMRLDRLQVAPPSHWAPARLALSLAAMTAPMIVGVVAAAVLCA